MDIQTVLSDLKLNGKVIPVVGGDVNQTYRIKPNIVLIFKNPSEKGFLKQK